MNRRTIFPLACTLVALCAVAGTPVATAALHSPTSTARGYERAIRDCASDGRLDRAYPEQTLRLAARHLPGDVEAYTNCPSVLRWAIARIRKPREILRRCAEGRTLGSSYRPWALRLALHRLRGDLPHRSGCRAAIRDALAARGQQP